MASTTLGDNSMVNTNLDDSTSLPPVADAADPGIGDSEGEATEGKKEAQRPKDSTTSDLEESSNDEGPGSACAVSPDFKGKAEFLPQYDSDEDDDDDEDDGTFYPRHYKDLGLRKCALGHYMHMSRRRCLDCGKSPATMEVDYRGVVELEDDVFHTDAAEGLSLQDLNMVECVNGHPQSKYTPECKVCGVSLRKAKSLEDLPRLGKCLLSDKTTRLCSRGHILLDTDKKCYHCGSTNPYYKEKAGERNNTLLAVIEQLDYYGM